MRGNGRVFQRGAVCWIAYFHRGQEIRESAKTPSRRKAENLLKERLRTAGTPSFIGPEAVVDGHDRVRACKIILKDDRDLEGGDL